MLSRALCVSVRTLFFMGMLSTSMPLFAQTCASNRDFWDWTVPVSQSVYLNDGGVVQRAVNLPYYAFDGFATNLNDPSGVDVLPSNGWVLLFRSFGTAACGTNMPYFVLYNRYHGLLRVFFYNHLTAQTFSFGQVILDETNTPDASLLSFDGGDSNHQLITVNQIGPDQWSYADFKLVTYDPNPHTDATFTFNINGITSTSLTLTGGIALNQVENDAQVAGIVDRTKGAVNSFGTDFKNTAAAAKILNDQATHNSTTWWAKAIKFATNNGTGIFLGDLFGATGFLKCFLGGGQTKAAPMHFQGQIQATGTLQTTGEVYSFILRVPRQPHSNPADLSLPLYDSKFGVFNPAIPTINRYLISGNCGISLTCTFNNPQAYISVAPLTIQFNPIVLTDATATVSTGFTFLNSPPEFTDPVQVIAPSVSLNLSGTFSETPQEIAIKITVQPNSAPPGQDPITIMKTYPFVARNAGFL